MTSLFLKLQKLSVPRRKTKKVKTRDQEIAKIKKPKEVEKA